MTKKKAKYRIRNWSDYNRSLVNRGSLTFWISEELLANWVETEKTGERGRSPRYTEAAIVVMASVKFVFHQAGRQTCGLVASVFRLLKVDLTVPDHSTLSRRMASVEVSLPLKASNKGRHIVCDSTGLKVYGEGEWKVRTHGISRTADVAKTALAVGSSNGRDSGGGSK